MQPLSVVERFFVAAHDAGMGLGATFAIGVDGELPRALVREAWEVLGVRYPILNCVLVDRHLLRDGWAGFAWKERTEDGPELIWEEVAERDQDLDGFRALLVEALERWGNLPLEIRRDPPVQLVVMRAGERRTGLILRVHHAALDGIALAVLSQDLVEILDALARGERFARQERRARPRGMAAYFSKLGPRGFAAAWLAQSRIGRWNRPRRNDALPLAWRDRSVTTRTAQVLFPAPELAAMRAASRARAMSINEAFLAAVARAVSEFAAARDVRLRKVTMAVPINLRGHRGLDPRDTISNQGIVVDIQVPSRLLERREDLLHAIRVQSQAIKRTPLPLLALLRAMLLFGLPHRVIVRSFRRLLARTRPPRTTATVTVTNVGPIWLRPDGSTVCSIGEARIVDVRHLYQCGFPMPGTIALYTYRDELHLEMSYAAGGLSQRDADGLLGKVKAQLFALLDLESVR